MWNEVKAIVSKDLRMEWRQPHALGSVFLYVVASIFVAYMGFKQIVNVATWNALFWIIILFASVNAVTKSFVQENSQRQLYYYQLAHPIAIILSKIITN